MADRKNRDHKEADRKVTGRKKDAAPKDSESTSEVESSEPVTPPLGPVAESEVEPVVEPEVVTLPEPEAVSEPEPVVEPVSESEPEPAVEPEPVVEPVSESKPEVTPTEEQVQEAAVLAKKSARNILVWILVAILIIGGFTLIRHFKGANDLAKIQGKVALSAQDLRDIVVAKKLTVYWAGPQDGAKYTLIATTPGVAFVRYLPGGVGLNDTKTLFRAIGTYAQKNAFAVSTAGAAANGNVGFVNADGNAVFYSKARPSNVYVGIKGKDIQVEVFDPVVDQALGLVLVKNQVRQIT